MNIGKFIIHKPTNIHNSEHVMWSGENGNAILSVISHLNLEI
jgi:hypothetical protein